MDFISGFCACSSDEKCEFVRKNCDPNRDEKMSVSTDSPGPVENHELIARFIYDPLHFSENLLHYDPIFFDLTRRGLSVNREVIASDIHGIGKSHANERTYVGYIRCRTSEIRQEHIDDGARVFVVLDTALPNNSAHADIFCLLEKKTKHLVRLILKNLFAGGLTKECVVIRPEQQQVVTPNALGSGQS